MSERLHDPCCPAAQFRTAVRAYTYIEIGWASIASLEDGKQ